MMTPQSLRQVARAFTRPIFAEMAKTGDANHALEFFRKAGILVDLKEARTRLTLATVFEEGWEALSNGYRNEYVYKNELAIRLIFKRHSPRTAGFQIELGVGHSIVDVAVANGTSTAYEIKTEFDSARRLKTQTTDYLNVFDKVFVVTHPSHIERYVHELDPRVGLIALTKRGSLRPYREAIPNSEYVDPLTIFKCLRRDEYVGAINSMLGEVPVMPNGVIARYCEDLFCTLSPCDAHKVFVKALRARTTDKNTIDFVSQLPLSLKALGYATPMSGRQRITLTELLSKSVT